MMICGVYCSYRRYTISNRKYTPRPDQGRHTIKKGENNMFTNLKNRIHAEAAEAQHPSDDVAVVQERSRLHVDRFLGRRALDIAAVGTNLKFVPVIFHTAHAAFTHCVHLYLTK